jgi:protein-disulfide isomerase
MSEENIENKGDVPSTEGATVPSQPIEHKEHKVHHTSSNNTITIKKDTLWKYATFVLAAVIIIGGFVFFIGDGQNGGSAGTGNVANNPPSAPTAPTAPPSIVEPNIEGAPSKGDPNAPVVLVEYTDYQCPFCGRHFTQTYPQLISEYVESGKVLYVSKDFPLNNIHPEAQKSAEAAHCMREQLGDDGYFLMHDRLFQDQGSLNNANYKKWARELGADGEEFDDCLDSGKTASIVQQGLTEGQQDGIRGTPGFLINGKALSGAQPFSAFKQAIDAEL